MTAALLLAASLAGAEDGPPEVPAGVEIRGHAGPDGQQYRHLFVAAVSVEEGKTYPLVVFLHGAGERGDDPRVLLKHFFPPMLTDARRAENPCFILAPQCPAGGRWGARHWGDAEGGAGEMRPELAAAAALVDEMLKSHPIDPDRVYLTGLSMGGYGTFDWLAREPGRFAAALAVCGGGDPATADRFKDVPLWVAHGDADPAVPVERSREMVAALRAAGGSPIYVEYPGVDHFSWVPAYGTPGGAVEWLFRQKR